LRELLDDLLVLDDDVGALLVPVDQVLDRRRQVAIRADDGDELTDVEPPLQRQIAAEQVEDEWRQLREKVVEIFNREFAAIELQPDVEDGAQPLADLRRVVTDDAVHMQRRRRIHHLAETSGELSRLQLTHPAEPYLLAAKLRNDEALHR